jgi:hypothetical protein
VDFMTKRVDEWGEDELEKQRMEKLLEQQEENRRKYANIKFDPEVTIYDFPIDDITVNEEGNLVIHSNGKEVINVYIPQKIAAALTPPSDPRPLTFIIEGTENAEGVKDQYFAFKDPATGKITITKVPGGRLLPTMNIKVPPEKLKIVTEKLVLLCEKYDDVTVVLLNKLWQKDFETFTTLRDKLERETLSAWQLASATESSNEPNAIDPVPESTAPNSIDTNESFFFASEEASLGEEASGDEVNQSYQTAYYSGVKSSRASIINALCKIRDYPTRIAPEIAHLIAAELIMKNEAGALAEENIEEAIEKSIDGVVESKIAQLLKKAEEDIIKSRE